MMKRSSSTSELFAGIFVREAIAAADDTWLQAMLDAESALARACASAGLIPAAAAEHIAHACKADDFDMATLGQAAATFGNPVVPLVQALSARVPEDVAPYVHFGATSQDILDTATMLVARAALAEVTTALEESASVAADLANEHRRTLQLGRTLLQPALPITFGLTAAGWLAALDDAALRVAWMGTHRLAAQLGGAAGTLAAFGESGPEVAAAYAANLGLPEPLLPWHTSRARIVDLAGVLGLAAGVIGKVAGDIVLLAQAEVAELSEAYGGGSSTLPQKRNPIAAVSAIGSARRAPGLGAAVLGSMDHELQRAGGAWHAEWMPLRDLMICTTASARWLADSLGHLVVDADRMRRNVKTAGDAILAERVADYLAIEKGTRVAHDLVAETIAEGRSLRDLAPSELFDPSSYLGSSALLIDRALAAHQTRSHE